MSVIIPVADSAFQPHDVTAISMAINDVCTALNVMDNSKEMRTAIERRIIDLARLGVRSRTPLANLVIQEAKRQDMFTRHHATADRHVAEGELRITRIRMAIDAATARGSDTAELEAMLERMLTAQRQIEEYRLQVRAFWLHFPIAASNARLNSHNGRGDGRSNTDGTRTALSS